jgi:hypothetical protein
MSYGDYPSTSLRAGSEQLTYLLFLKMADERTKTPYNQPSAVPAKYDWPTLLKKDGDDLFDNLPIPMSSPRRSWKTWRRHWSSSGRLWGILVVQLVRRRPSDYESTDQVTCSYFFGCYHTSHDKLAVVW